MKALRVTNWSRFEKSDSKKCVTMTWVSVPINHSGLGYLEIMSHPDGIRMIGGWLLILQVAAQCPTRGLLVADSGRVIGAREIALKTRAQEKDITACIALLLQNGWLEEVEVSGQHPDTIRTASGLQDSTVQDKTGETRTSATPPAAPEPEIKTRPRDHWRYVQLEPWVSRGKRAGCTITASNFESWQGAIERTGGDAERFFRHAEGMPADKRWHDKIEASLMALAVPKSTHGPKWLAWLSAGGTGPEPEAHE